MITYEVDILDVKTGEVKRVDSFVGWTQWSPKIYREGMCDCNLAGTRNRELIQTNFGLSVEAHELASYKWRAKNGGCDHSMPPKANEGAQGVSAGWSYLRFRQRRVPEGCGVRRRFTSSEEHK